ncbi:HEAT repeat domain-containing protein [Actinomadura sp. WMMB 499]|uniref:HEAT repeat domain-containing protein n=1 Tax=Actinomadura sp. WMMB 499 TaxID=1219491 RepID=UPI001243E1E4|nr:HEAT repeat domain-containing protein [Actinomadura sp. WMMB 499]QFG20865.1 HEAT repeat domain-containing protein [Actinomadura sp. WMMB 499]
MTETGMHVRIQCLRDAIVARPETVRDEPAGEPLYQAVHGLPAADVPDPGRLARELAARVDPVLRAAAFRLVREALHAGLLPPAEARALVEDLAADVPAALRELAEPWAVLAPLPRGRARRYLETGPDGDATEVAARHGHRDLVRDVAADPGRTPAVRRRALELLGDLAAREDVPDLLAVACTDPPLFAAPAFACLTGLHRRGRFPQDRDVPSLVGLALADHHVAAEDVAIVLYTCRNAALHELTAGEADLSRRLELLVALDAQGAPGLDVGGAVTDLARRAADPAPHLRAIRELAHVPAEETVLDLLPRAPLPALAALEAVGGDRTAGVLWTGLGLDGGEIVPHLRAHRHRALEILWHLTGDPARRRALLDVLDPRDLPRRIAADLGGPDPRELAVLAANPDPGDPPDALCRLARNGDATTLPAIADLLLRVVSDLAATWGDGPEPVVSDEVVAEIQALGRRLHRRGAIRPRCLLDAPGEPGHRLLTGLALDLLDRPGLSPAEQAILLGLPCAACAPGTRARVRPFLRHRDRHVRKKAIGLLATGDARALSASLIPLTRAEDPQTVRQALLALESTGATWAAPAIAACLDHPNMNVKKTAATALQTAGSPPAVPALLSWLGRHDNPGFREALVKALRSILRDAFAATVRAAADRTDDARARTRLLSALPTREPRHPADWLAEHGWAPEVARRAVSARTTGTSRMRAMLPHWLDLLAEDDPGASVLRFVLALCTPPWTDTELETLARSASPLVDALPTVPEGPDRTRLVELLHAAIPRTGPAGRRTLAARLRRMPPDRDGLALLHRCGEAPTRHDVVRALAAARDTERPAEAETALLREAFTEGPTRLGAPPEAARAPRNNARDGAPSHPSGGADGRGARSAVRDLRGGASGRPSAELAEVLRGAVRSAAAVRTLRARTAAATGAPSGRWAVDSGEVLAEVEAAAGSARERRGVDRVPPGRTGGGGLPGTDDGGSPRERWSSRAWLSALIEVFPAAAPEAREELLDWMLELQPLGVPPWTIGEEAPRAAEGRTPRADDLDQPWSAAQRDRLLRMLEDGTAEQRETAARMLLERPEPSARLPVLRAYLDGRLDIEIAPALVRALPHVPRPSPPGAGRHEPEAPGLDGAAPGPLLSPGSVRAADRGFLERFVRLVGCSDADEIGGFVPVLVEVWEHGGSGAREHARHALRRAPADIVAEAIADRVEAGERGMLDLVAGRPLLRTPVFARAVERLRAEGRGDLADRLDLVDGPFRAAGAAERDARTLAGLRERRDPPPEPTRDELFLQAREGAPADVRRALTRLAEGARAPDPELAGLLGELLGHRERKVRLQALRVSRGFLPREEYLDRTVGLLDDRDSDVVLTAIRTLAHAGWAPAIPGLIALLGHSRPVVARDVREALVRLGEQTLPALRRAEGRARPDRRHVYTCLIERIRDEEGEDR